MKKKITISEAWKLIEKQFRHRYEGTGNWETKNMTSTGLCWAVKYLFKHNYLSEARGKIMLNRISDYMNMFNFNEPKSFIYSFDRKSALQRARLAKMLAGTKKKWYRLL